MEKHRCPSCGRRIVLAARCPNCGARQADWADELARIDRSIAEMKARDAAIAKEQKQIASQLQAALFQRDILAAAAEEPQKKTSRTRRLLRRPGQRPPTAGPGTPPPRVPRQGKPAERPSPRVAPHPAEPAEVPPWSPDDPESLGSRPEASSREVQNIQLGLGALLLGVAAIVFVAVAITSFEAVSRVVILLVATALMLAAPPMIARRGLTSTAETIAAIGLLLVPLTGYAVWTVDAARVWPIPGSVYGGLIFLITAVVAGAYARVVDLRAPRYATVLAIQPVLPLLAYVWISGAAGWALALTLVAAIDLLLGRALATGERLLPGEAASAGPRRPAPAGQSRPESAPEEADAVVVTESAWSIPSLLPPTPWLRELCFALHGLAILAALGFAVVALLGANLVPGALRAGLALLLAAAVGLAGALTVNRAPLPNLAAGVLTLAVIGAAGRVTAVALPGRALLLIAVVIAATGVGVRILPDTARRGPQLASAAALMVIGVIVAGSALRAALALMRAALPAWDADLTDYAEQLGAAVGPAGWQLATTAFLLTVAALLALPPEVRREAAVAGTALTALALPASFGLGWAAAPWPLVLAVAGIGLAGLTATTRRAALTHVIAAAGVGLVAAGAAAARPGLTAAVLTALAVVGVLTAMAPAPAALLPRPGQPGATRFAAFGPDDGDADRVVREWAAGGAAFAVPGAVAAFVAAVVSLPANPTAAQLRDATEPILVASFLAVCATLGYAALTQVAQRQVSLPLTVGTGLGALAVTAAAFGSPGTTLFDIVVAALLLVAAALLVFTPAIDAGRRADRLLDGADIAAAAAAVALAVALARTAMVLTSGGVLTAVALLALLLSVAVRAMPEDWRRGPIVGLAIGGGVAVGYAGCLALAGGLRVLALPGPIWGSDLDAWSAVTDSGTWQVPVALVLLAIAAAVALPRPWGYDVAGACAVLATIGTPAALNLDWWSPIAVGAAVATGFGVAAVAAADPRAARSRAVVAGAVALHAVGASLARPWTTAAAAGVVVLIGAAVAILARGMTRLDDPDDMPPHLAQIGGAATGAALLALPAAVAAFAAELGWTAQVVLGAALAATSLGTAVVGMAARYAPQYLPYATVGIAGGATVIAVVALPTGLPWGIYAAAAALLGVLAELLRAASPAPARDAIRHWSVRSVAGDPTDDGPAVDESLRARRRWAVSPAMGALIAAALPVLLTVAAIAPVLMAALVSPYGTLGRIWHGTPLELIEPTTGAADSGNVLAALLLTLAAGLAAAGFAGGPARAIPVVLPGAAITLLIAPISLGLGWPASTMAALAVFTLAMLGLALTAPPSINERARSLRVARILVFCIGLAAGGAGLAGSLATRGMTLFTLGGAVVVGAVAALAGRSQLARILGWLFASIMGQLFVLTAGLVFGLERVWSAFGVLVVGALLIFGTATIPRLSYPEAAREASTVEWSGHGAALIALALAHDSPGHAAALLAAWGAVLGVAATRVGRGVLERRILFWSAVGCEVVAWWVLMRVADVGLPEAYTLPFAALALLVGLLELRHRPDLSSWAAYGPALIAALVPSLVIVLVSGGNLRQVLLLLGAVATLIFGSIRQQQAPVIIGAAVTTIATLHLLTTFGPWLVLIPIGFVLLVLGASNESRRRTQERFRVVRGMQ